MKSQCQNCIYYNNMFIGLCSNTYAREEQTMQDQNKQKCRFYQSKEEDLK